MFKSPEVGLGVIAGSRLKVSTSAGRPQPKVCAASPSVVVSCIPYLCGCVSMGLENGDMGLDNGDMGLDNDDIVWMMSPSQESTALTGEN